MTKESEIVKYSISKVLRKHYWLYPFKFSAEVKETSQYTILIKIEELFWKSQEASDSDSKSLLRLKSDSDVNQRSLGDHFRNS